MERCLAITYRLLQKDDVWLFVDRLTAAGDNAEALFKYVVEQNNHSIRPYFVIAKTSPDYKRLKKIGKVVHPSSLRHKLLFLSARKVISSHADLFITNPFDDRVHDLAELFVFDFVFLQHGITHNDLSGWLNRYNKDIKLFVAAARPERDSLLSDAYGYDDNVVKLTGFPRYDYLINAPQRKLILAPTWRHNLGGGVDTATGTRRYNKDFTKSAYYSFYQSLIDDKRIQKALSTSGMTAEFYLHPSLAAQIRDFEASKSWQVVKMPYDYRTAFSEGDIMVTDYSSVAFDFAYLKKPVIYTQFDKEDFYSKHSWSPSYFSYEKHGFGPVVYDYESAVSEILKTIKRGNTMTASYQTRVNNFFAYNDQRNSDRVYTILIEDDKRG
jgi:CDP-glycerol glycerophosphotransferase (TagB/SpsB family)